MRYIPDEGRIVWSASDVKVAAECEFAWLRAIDARLGRVAAVEEPEDETLKRAGRLGIEHEKRMLATYRERFGDGVVEIPETRSGNADGLAAAVTQTRAALASDASVIYQAAFATHDFVGFADFLVRDADGRWLVQDTKLARRARVTALMQLAAYVDQLDLLGVARADRVELILGDGSVSVHAVDDLLPVFELRRERLRALIADRRLDRAGAGEPIAWGDDRGELGVLACGRCATCDAEVVASRDLLLVAGMRPVQRQRLRAAGIDTVDELAQALVPPTGMRAEVFQMLRTQTRLQLDSPAGLPPLVQPQAQPTEDVPVPSYEVVAPKALGALPRPDRGDLFFDFEGDPLHTQPGTPLWGIDYLFGWVDVREQYSSLWAHSFDEERRTFESFLDIVALQRQQHPGMHIYHYAPYEPTHLLAMAARYGVREADVDRLLRDGVFVDLYPIVRRALRVGSRSYSIKKLEPLYMGADVRTSDVQKGDDSIVRYAQAMSLRDDGDDGAAHDILEDLADYNRYDCVSTLRLRDWLVDRAREAGLRPSTDPEPDETVYEPSSRSVALQALAEDLPHDSAEAIALRLGAAAIDYYPRESKSFWASHFLRLREPVSVWEETRDVLVVDDARSHVIDEWQRPESGRVESRVVSLRGDLAPGTRFTESSDPFALYELPAPYPADPSARAIHAARQVSVLETLEDGVVITERAVDGVTWDRRPLALTPGAPPRAGNQQKAIDDWADAVIAAAPDLPMDPAMDILLRRPPRARSGALVRSEDNVDAIVGSVIDLDRSYLAVQGPPGTGKTYVGSHVIARLIREQHFRIGVVAQSHAVVEHMLDEIVAAGVPPELVGKAPKDPAPDQTFTVFAKNAMAAFAAEHADTGFVVGGTAWDFSHEGRIARGGLDLLVIDEAGQFSLASTVAVSLAASRLLLLGDPQQLPQVSQGTHPEPVDTSALGWVMSGADVIAPEFGYFLAHTWRMHPRVAEAVSRLSYAGELDSHPSTQTRSLAGVQPGVHPVAVRHHGNATQSLEEAAEVVGIIRNLLGREWIGTVRNDAGDAVSDVGRPLAQRDVIVVTPYNAQQVAVESALAAAGFDEVRVGTVDRFQGQEAVVSIVSLAASSGRDAPRGLDFLLLRNRLNAAISRAQQAAYVVYSPRLLDDLPRTPEGVARLSGFARLVSGSAGHVGRGAAGAA